MAKLTVIFVLFVVANLEVSANLGRIKQQLISDIKNLDVDEQIFSIDYDEADLASQHGEKDDKTDPRFCSKFSKKPLQLECVRRGWQKNPKPSERWQKPKPPVTPEPTVTMPIITTPPTPEPTVNIPTITQPPVTKPPITPESTVTIPTISTQPAIKPPVIMHPVSPGPTITVPPVMEPPITPTTTLPVGTKPPTQPNKTVLPSTQRPGQIVFPDDDGYNTTPFPPTAKPNPTQPVTPIPLTTPSNVDVAKEPVVVVSSPNTVVTPLPDAIRECMGSCRVSPEYDPVCGSDGVTYINPEHLICAQQCGSNVRQVYKGRCEVTSSTTTSSSVVVTPLPDAIKECMRNCRVSPEYDPVCGSDGVTYINPEHLICAQQCGSNVRQVYKGRCEVTSSTTTSSSVVVTPLPDAIRECIQNCPVTPEYNPVCGSDGVTYTNPGRLICAQQCGSSVRQVSKGRCVDTSSTTSSPVVSTPLLPIVRECIRKCPNTPEYNPVCGTDGVNYKNPGDLLCAQKCGVPVEFKSYGPCSTNMPTKSPITVDPNKDIDINVTPLPDAMRECMRNCRVSPEYDPVCGSDGVTYINPEHLICAQQCGSNVRQVYKGRCEVTSSTTTSFSVVVTPLPDAIRECIQNCPVTPEYNPVCGSDGVTYTNPGRLICAQQCGSSVRQVSKGRCVDTSSTTSSPVVSTPLLPIVRECIRKCPNTPEYNPVCGTDGVNYKNPGELLCAQKCGVPVEFKSYGPCSTNMPTKSPITVDPNKDIDINVTPSPAVIRECMLNCPVTSEYNPQCGNDGVTYTNPGRLLCARNCGTNVHLVSNGPCAVTPATTTYPVVTTPSFAKIRECIRKCPNTPELNPVCGTDDFTYNNPGELNCAQKCGIPVEMKTNDPCPNSMSTKSPITKKPNNNYAIDENVHECLLACPPTKQYDPVCGSNFIVYPSPARLDCARNCGVRVNMVSRGRCPSSPRPTLITVPPNIPSSTASSISSTTTLSYKMQGCIDRCASTPEYNPVCGTDARSYRNLGKLQCARTCGVDVDLLRQGHCISPRRRNLDKTSVAVVDLVSTTTAAAEPTV